MTPRPAPVYLIGLFVSIYCLIFFGNLVLAFSDKTAKKGDKVSVEYEGSLDDGTVFDSSKNHDKLLQFVVGSSQVIQGFDKAVIGMMVNEEKIIKLKPAEAYGEIKEKLIHQIMRSNLPPKPKPKPGMGLMMGVPGSQRRALIKEVSKDHIVIDMNHPLAGKTLTFSIKLVKISH